MALAPSAISYVVSFLVIMSFWMAHRAQFRAIANRRLGWLNGLFLMVVASLPFSTGLFDRYPTAPLAIVIYAGSLALARLPETVEPSSPQWAAVRKTVGEISVPEQ